LAKFFDWPGLAQVCRIERIRKVKGCVTTEIAYAITSLAPERASAADLLALNRGHWGIENRLHWVRDVSLGEDACRAKAQNCPQNLAALRNVGLTLMRASDLGGCLRMQFEAIASYALAMIFREIRIAPYQPNPGFL